MNNPNVIHLCIDAQNGERSKYPYRSWMGMEENIRFLSSAFAAADIETVHVAFVGPSTNNWDAVRRFDQIPDETNKTWQRGDRFTQPLSPSDLVAFKCDFSAYSSSSLVQYLEDKKITDIVLSGVVEMRHPDEINVTCVSSTARDFRKAGYEVTIAAEATNRGMEGCVSFSPLNYRRKNHAALGVDVEPVNDIFDQYQIGARLPERPKQKKSLVSRIVDTVLKPIM